MTQIIKPTSEAESADVKEGFSLISNAKLTEIYATMLKCREIEERTRALFAQGKLRSDLGVSAGREASATAIAGELQREDGLSIANGDLMPGFVKGMALESLFRLLSEGGGANRESATQDGFASLHVVLPLNVAAQIKEVCKFALTEKTEKRGRIAVAFFAGEEAGQWQEAMSLAGAQELPVVFVQHGAHEEQKGSHTTGKRDVSGALVNGIPAIVADGSDAVALYRVACEAMARARQGRGATLIECLNPNEMEPTDSGKGRIYRDSELVEEDPVLGMENYLKRKGLWTEKLHRDVVADIRRELDVATRFLND
jgi:2-oxoisovalerate dehydrogenase E1 component alpha subunit